MSTVRTIRRACLLAAAAPAVAIGLCAASYADDVAVVEHYTLSCDPGVLEASFIIDLHQATHEATVTYRNAKLRPENLAPKACPEKMCALDEKKYIYCETWRADFVDNVVHWFRCQDTEQKDEVTLDLRSGRMRQRFIGDAVQGIKPRSWTCAIAKDKVIAVSGTKKVTTEETSVEKAVTEPGIPEKVTKEKTKTEKITTEKVSPLGQ
jgi:hypothetical protein